MVSVNTVLDLLQSERRRYALYYLDDQDGPVPVEEVAEEVARMESEAAVSENELDRYELSICSKLPKAASVDFIEFDRDDGKVRLTDEPPTFEILLTITETLERPS